MKKALWVLLIIPILISCNQKKVKNLEQKNDSLVQQAFQKDQSIGEFLSAFSEIQDNLDSIKTKEMIITESTEGNTELKKNAKDQIKDDINTIYLLLNDAQDKLAQMRKDLGKSNYKVQELEKMVSFMEQQIIEKDKEIEVLRLELEQLNIKVTKLTRDVDNLSQENKEKSEIIKGQSEEISDKTESLNTAYFALGTKKVLKDNNIISAEGGFIGIGKSKTLKQDFNEEYFTKIDITETKNISIPGKKIQIITNHPSESYTITGEGDERVLEITNAIDFWKSSKYLVVMID